MTTTVTAKQGTSPVIQSGVRETGVTGACPGAEAAAPALEHGMYARETRSRPRREPQGILALLGREDVNPGNRR
jgi:hypothetical protein